MDYKERNNEQVRLLEEAIRQKMAERNKTLQEFYEHPLITLDQYFSNGSDPIALDVCDSSYWDNLQKEIASWKFIEETNDFVPDTLD